jgi:hypothetical protein
MYIPEVFMLIAWSLLGLLALRVLWSVIGYFFVLRPHRGGGSGMIGVAILFLLPELFIVSDPAILLWPIKKIEKFFDWLLNQ